MFREDVVRRLIHDHLSRTVNNSRRIWALIQLELWQRTYVDPTRTEAPVALPIA
jgi:asparagine synthase (glutamine-hydrolysing)